MIVVVISASGDLRVHERTGKTNRTVCGLDVSEKETQRPSTPETNRPCRRCGLLLNNRDRLQLLDGASLAYWTTEGMVRR